ncbi:alpha/beta hydrolase [Rhodovarius crocodyli]|uniref:Alpha/beta hydrolase n=1 Tax=Rhodovarius crocodyli TaxID=1979269 RepID=A0A437MM89_9PROT|nr:alpha/beta hydrolase [Rhodovarius crocodyli]RVT98742.1 alpha/beta hydrolase [Rhodovarius crocodyli]
MQRLTIAQTELLRRPGPGPSLVLLHGIGSNAESWLPLIQALPTDWDVLAWWAPGYGASARVASPTPAAYAARLAAVLEALGLHQVGLLGHSLGCLFAGAFARLAPGRVARLGFLSPALGYRVPAGAPLPPAVAARIADLEALGPAEFAARRAARLVFEPERKPQVLAAVRGAMAAVNPPGYADAVHALGAGDLAADAAALPFPALVAAGAEDVVTPPANARALHAALPVGSPLHLIPGAGHALPQEAPAELAALLHPWFACREGTRP